MNKVMNRHKKRSFYYSVGNCVASERKPNHRITSKVVLILVFILNVKLYINPDFDTEYINCQTVFECNHVMKFHLY